MPAVLCHGRLRKGWPTRCIRLSKTQQNLEGVPLHMARESGPQAFNETGGNAAARTCNLLPGASAGLPRGESPARSERYLGSWNTITVKNCGDPYEIAPIWDRHVASDTGT